MFNNRSFVKVVCPCRRDLVRQISITVVLSSPQFKWIKQVTTFFLLYLAKERHRAALRDEVVRFCSSRTRSFGHRDTDTALTGLWHLMDRTDHWLINRGNNRSFSRKDQRVNFRSFNETSDPVWKEISRLETNKNNLKPRRFLEELQTSWCIPKKMALPTVLLLHIQNTTRNTPTHQRSSLCSRI